MERFRRGLELVVRTSGVDQAISPYSSYRSHLLESNGTSNLTCNLLVDSDDVKDGKLPQVLAIGALAWLAGIIVFLVIRYTASDYSRAGLATSSQYVETVTSHSKFQPEQKERSLSLSTMLYEDKHWYTWFINFFYRVRSSDIRHRCGPDATLYLSLHSYLIVLLCVFCVLSLIVILPVNYLAGNLEKDQGGFPRTTISNLDPRSGVLWVHTLFCIVYLLISVAFMVHYSLQLGRYQQEYSNNSVMVQWIPSVVHREDILQHLQEAYPSSCVADFQMAYDVDHLVSLNNKLTSVCDNLAEVDSLRNDLRIESTIRVSWRKFFCCVDSYKCDAKVYYEGQYKQLRDEIHAEKEKVKMSKKLGIGFITFGNEKDAKIFSDSYKPLRKRPRSSLYNDVRAGWWWVSSAPFPMDLIWENLSIPYIVWWMRWCIINIILVVFVFFFTTPSILITSIDQIRVILTNLTHIPDPTHINSTITDPLLRIIVPNLLLLFFASLLPFVVSYSSYFEAHWTKSFREQTIMRKTYLFLLLMLIILPSIGLASLNAVAELTKESHFEDVLKDRLKCVFLPNNGAFFIGYVITSAFIGSVVKLLRVPELFMYMFKRCQARTRLQKELALKKAASYEFRYGVEYAWNLVIFNMIISFSLTAPLIIPFGVVYFLLTYYTDRYNIYYVYRPASYNGRQFLHRSAVNFVIVGAVQLQLVMLFFSVIRLGNIDPRSIIMMVTFTLTCLICIGVMFFGFFKHLIPQLRIKLGKEYVMLGSPSQGEGLISSLNDSEETGEYTVKGAYIPSVLRDSPQTEPPKDHSYSGFGYQSFGSTDRMGRKSTTNTPTSPGHTLLATPQQPAVSTLERNANKSGGGAGGKKHEVVTLTDPDKPKSFV